MTGCLFIEQWFGFIELYKRLRQAYYFILMRERETWKSANAAQDLSTEEEFRNMLMYLPISAPLRTTTRIRNGTLNVLNRGCFKGYIMNVRNDKR